MINSLPQNQLLISQSYKWMSFTCHRTRTVFPSIIFKTWPRVWLGIISTSKPGNAYGREISTIFGQSSAEDKPGILNKDVTPHILSKKLYLFNWKRKTSHRKPIIVKQSMQQETNERHIVWKRWDHQTLSTVPASGTTLWSKKHKYLNKLTYIF